MKYIKFIYKNIILLGLIFFSAIVFNISCQAKINDLPSNLYPIKEDGQWGLIDDIGNTVLPPQYDSIGFFKYGYALAFKNQKFTLINKKGIPIGDFIRGSVEELSKKWILIRYLDTIWAMDTATTVLCKKVIPNLSDVDRVYAGKNGQLFFDVSLEGKNQTFSMPLYYDFEHVFRITKHTSKNNMDSTLYYDTQDRLQLSLLGFGSDYNVLTKTAYQVLTKVENGKIERHTYLIDSIGNQLKEVPKHWNYIYQKINIFLLKSEQTGLVGISNFDDSPILKPLYTHIHILNSNIALVSNNDSKVALFDIIKRQFITNFTFDLPIFHETDNFDLILLSKSGKWVYLNQEGALVWEEK